MLALLCWHAGSASLTRPCASWRRRALWCGPAVASTSLRKACAVTANTSGGQHHSAAGRHRWRHCATSGSGAREQADALALKNAAARGELLEAAAVAAEWSGVLREVRAGMLAVPSRAAQRLQHLTPHDIAEIDAEVRAVLTELGGGH